MRIVIDMQGAQTESRFRGIGRYSLSFAKAVIENCQNDEVILVLNGLFSESIEPIRKAFREDLPQSQIQVWEVPGPLGIANPNNQLPYAMAKRFRHAFIANLKPDVVHLTSLFEGYSDNAVAEIESFGPHVFSSVALYDLIPYVNQKQYLDPNPSYALFYLNKIEQLNAADACLSISEFAAQEAKQYLPALTEKIQTISTAIDAQFGQVQMAELEVENILHRLGIERKFVLYTGGADERKNLPRLIEAYANLPAAIKSTTQLVFAGRLADQFVLQLQDVAQKFDLKKNELLLTGFVTDAELITLYSQCHCFVFPSWQEGFGLPALEAMACGAATITSNTSSLPEVVAYEEAMFDPYSVVQMGHKLLQTFEDQAYRERLIRNGLERAKLFTWKDVALRALNIWKQWSVQRAKGLNHAPSLGHLQTQKPKMAFVSPLPPVQSGIAAYSALLLDSLSAYYDIDVITQTDSPEILSQQLCLPVCSVESLHDNAQSYARVLYQLGNSPTHASTLALMRAVPGVIMLHDFYLSGLKSWLEEHDHHVGVWTQALYESHGYEALDVWSKDPHQALLKFPVNLEQLLLAKGVLTHSEFAKSLVEKWYGPSLAASIQVIPLLRDVPKPPDRQAARERLGIHPDTQLVCSFGFIDQTKHSKHLLSAWAQSSLSVLPHSQLVFVGKNEGGDYGQSLINSIQQSGRQDRVLITGFVDDSVYADYLAAADVAVQLRSVSRGETSAAALDCLAAGLPTVVNANGAMAELPAEVVWQLQDEFSIEDLTLALEMLAANGERRESMRQAARSFIHTHHAPQHCALAYQSAIENFYQRDQKLAIEVANDLATLIPENFGKSQSLRWAESVSWNFPGVQPVRKLFLDITATHDTSRQTGIERVAISLLLELLKNPPLGFRVEPVHLSSLGNRWHARYARQFACRLQNLRTTQLDDDVVEPQPGDVYVTLDLASGPFIQASEAGLFEKFRQRGVAMHALVYDLLPIHLPNAFPPGAQAMHTEWLKAVAKLDGALCISNSVKADLQAWLSEQSITWQNRRPFSIASFALGANLWELPASANDPSILATLLGQLPTGKIFLSVGTLEPRKHFMQALLAFEDLWARQIDVNWVLVGREGWTQLPADQRQEILMLVQRIQAHPEKNKRLFWLNDLQDESLAHLYAHSNCLLSTSLGEGLGLPLLEAAQYRLPMLLRDLPVFREVAGEHASYFNANTPEGLALAIESWLNLKDQDKPDVTQIQTVTWAESAKQFLKFTGLRA